MTGIILAAVVSTNVFALAGTYCSYTNAPCAACVKRAERVLSARYHPELPDGMKPSKPKEPAIHILGRKYPVKGKR